MTDRHRTTDPRLDDDDPEVPEPTGPEPREPSDNQTLSSPVNELENRLFSQRKVLVFGAITDKVARDVTGRLLALAGASDKPIDLFVNSPGGLPPALAARWNAEINRALDAPEVQRRFVENGLQRIGGSREDFLRQIAADREKWGKLVREHNIRAD